MPYGIIKVDTITFTDAGVDKSIQISGLVQNPTFSGNVTCTGTISGVTVTGTVGAFTTVSGITVTGTTANFTSGNFTNISGGTYTITSGVFAAGSAASPSISFTGDSNTGLYSPGADQVAISTNGSGRLSIDSAGNISFLSCGLRARTGRIFDADASNAGIVIFGGAGDGANIELFGGTHATLANLGIIDADEFRFRNATGATERLRIDSSGRLLVGTSTADTTHFASVGKLFVEGATDASSALVQTCWNASDTSQAVHIISKSGGASVGTRGIVADGENLGMIRFEGDDGTNFIGAATIRAFVDGTPGTNDMPGRLTFSTTADGASSPTERMRIDSSGRVGIGTTSPTSPLHVLAPSVAGGISALIAMENNHILRLARISPAANPGNFDFTVSTYGAGTIAADNQLTLQAGSSTPLVFNTSGANERARIDSSGRLLVGTSSARSNFANTTLSARLQVEGTNFNESAVSSIRNSNDVFGPAFVVSKSRGTTVGSNTIVSNGDELGSIFFQGSDGSEFVLGARIDAIVDGTPGADDMPGRLVFSTTADGASSPTERMRIAQNGVVTIQNGAVAVIGTLTDAATITPDLAADCNFTVTLGGARTIANPTNITAGQSGSIFLVQDGTGGRTASWGSYWDFPGGTAPTLSTAANAVDRVDYIVRSSTSIHTVFTANYS